MNGVGPRREVEGRRQWPAAKQHGRGRSRRTHDSGAARRPSSPARGRALSPRGTGARRVAPRAQSRIVVETERRQQAAGHAAPPGAASAAGHVSQRRPRAFRRARALRARRCSKTANSPWLSVPEAISDAAAQDAETSTGLRPAPRTPSQKRSPGRNGARNLTAGTPPIPGAPNAADGRRARRVAQQQHAGHHRVARGNDPANAACSSLTSSLTPESCATPSARPGGAREREQRFARPPCRSRCAAAIRRSAAGSGRKAASMRPRSSARMSRAAQPGATSPARRAVRCAGAARASGRKNTPSRTPRTPEQLGG